LPWDRSVSPTPISDTRPCPNLTRARGKRRESGGRGVDRWRLGPSRSAFRAGLLTCTTGPQIASASGPALSPPTREDERRPLLHRRSILRRWLRTFRTGYGLGALDQLAKVGRPPRLSQLSGPFGVVVQSQLGRPECLDRRFALPPELIVEDRQQGRG